MRLWCMWRTCAGTISPFITQVCSVSLKAACVVFLRCAKGCLDVGGLLASNFTIALQLKTAGLRNFTVVD